jgi:hypothetical protein
MAGKEEHLLELKAHLEKEFTLTFSGISPKSFDYIGIA